MHKQLIIGTRGSPLALAQAQEVKSTLLKKCPQFSSPDDIHIQIIRTTGDRILDRPLIEIGGKGLFTKELEQALLIRRIDIAVHSLKDVGVIQPPGLELSAILKREDPRDAFVSQKAKNIEDLPSGSIVGTASLRRQACILHKRPDLNVVPLRGNVQTRLRKMFEEHVDALILAYAGLKRLGATHFVSQTIPSRFMLPAVAQGTIAIQAREFDTDITDLLKPLHHEQTSIQVLCERAALEAVEGSCRMPIASLAKIDSDTISVRSQLLLPDGSKIFESKKSGPMKDYLSIGAQSGLDLREQAGEKVLQELLELTRG